MHRRIQFHPRPLAIVVAIVLCLMASHAFGQVRRLGPSTTTTRPATTGLPAGSPAPSGLTSGAAPGLVSGTPSASGLTSGSAPALPAGSPLASGLTSGTAGGNTAVVVPVGPTDTTATSTGGSTRGVVVIPVDTGAGTSGSTGTTGTTGTAGTATGTAGTTGATGTTTGTSGTGATAGTAGTTGAFAAQPGGFAGVTNGVPSVSPTRAQMISGPVTALEVVQLFSQADADGDGLLSRAEALRLPIVTMSFDDMDTNRDGVVSRSEYDTSLR